MTLPAQNHFAWKGPYNGVVLFRVLIEHHVVSITILHAFAFLSTILRLYHRFKSRVWWDDAVVIIALVMDTFYLVHFWVKYKGHGSSYSTLTGSSCIPKKRICADLREGTSRPPPGFLWSAWFSAFLYSSTLWLVDSFMHI